ncbi:ABC transporter substrate-binding protein [Thermodesulfobacteriota bacterium]
MMLSDKVLRKKFGFRLTTSCILAAIALVLVIAGTVTAAGRPKTVAELALYKGADRQQILEEGAKKEGKLVFYTTGTQAKWIAKAFQKKYPYIKMQLYRAGSRKLLPRVLEEYKIGKHVVDVIGPTQMMETVLKESGILEPFYSPELAYIEESAIRKAPGGGVFSAGHFSSGRGVGWNTNLTTKDQIPNTYQDLLDPKWKGKMTIIGASTGVLWMGAILNAHGEEFVKKLAKQQFTVHMISGRALNDMIIAGEYAFSPSITDSHVAKSKQMGAPVDWIPLEPSGCNLGQITLPKHSAHPHAALLYIDFDLSKQAGDIYRAEGYNSLRKDVANLRTYKKDYVFNSTKDAVNLTDLFDKLFLKR